MVRKCGAYAAMSAFLATMPNVAFMAVPLISFLLPDNSLALSTASLCALLYFPVMLYTDTRLEMARHKDESRLQALRSLCRAIVRNPSITAPACALALNLSSIETPLPVLNMTAMLGATAAPCALFALGMVLQRQLASAQGIPKGWLWRHFPVHFIKLAGMPVITFFILRLFGVSGIMLGVATLCAGMPSGAASNVLSEKYQVAVHDTSISICFTTALSMATISVNIAILYSLGAL